MLYKPGKIIGQMPQQIVACAQFQAFSHGSNGRNTMRRHTAKVSPEN
jgi:hypothetical protein